MTAPGASGGGSPDAPCRLDPCSAKLYVGDELEKWRSTEIFYPRNEVLIANLRVRGRKLRMDGTFGPGGCRSRHVGSGLVAIVKRCGDATPLRVRAVRFKGRRGPLGIRYRAEPELRGD